MVSLVPLAHLDPVVVLVMLALLVLLDLLGHLVPQAHLAAALTSASCPSLLRRKLTMVVATTELMMLM